MASDALASPFATGLAAFQHALDRAFPSIWDRILAEAQRPSPVSRLWSVYNEGYLLRGPGDASMVVAIDLVQPKRISDASRRHLLDHLPPASLLPLLLVTHRHGDHLDPEVAQAMLAAGATVALPMDAWSVLREKLNLGETPPGIRLVKAGDTFSIQDVDVAVHAADHRSESVPESVAFEVRFGGITVLHAADHRAFKSPADSWPRGVDVLVLSFYHAEAESQKASPAAKDGMRQDRAWSDRFGWDWTAAFVEFAARLAPKRLVLGHLYELSHEPEMIWRFADTGIVREVLFARAPEIRARALAPGDCLALA